jgi:hypothetical protein
VADAVACGAIPGLVGLLGSDVALTAKAAMEAL